MNSLCIRDVRIVNPGKSVATGDVLVCEGRIAAVGTIALATAQGAESVDGSGRLLTPGLIDIHTHGLMHSIYESGPDAFRAAARELGQFGVTTVVPTIIPRMQAGWPELLKAIVATIPAVTEVNIAGLHLEGPFMAIAGAACPTLPGDLALLDQLLEITAGHLAVMSVSPETPQILPVIRRLREKGIAVFLTHTRASAEDTDLALEAGASHATHFYDVFYAPAETDPGVRPVGAVEAILADPRASVDFIGDGVHVHPTAIRAAVAAKTYRGVILITDSNIGAGLSPGVYETPWGFPVRVKDGDGARHATKLTLAGSALTMNRGMANFLKWLKLPPEQVWAMGTANPARLLGLENKGRIEVGADADLVLWENDLTPARTWVRGKCVYEKNHL
jgi:N-acetylglucosamine-6-phosphate deacetylase